MTTKEGYITPTTIIFSMVFVGDLISEIFFDFDPILEYFLFLERSHFLWGISFSLFGPLGLALFSKIRYKNNVTKLLEQFKTTTHTIQDICQNNTTQIQILILDLEEANVPQKLIDNANDIFNSTKNMINQFSDINPITTPVIKLNKNVKIFDIN